jgi:urease accessory protein
MGDHHLGPARVGIGGPVGAGKTALIEAMLPRLCKRNIDVAVVTNDLVTREDAERLQRGGLIEAGRVIGVETGACPHTAIREDPTLNAGAIDRLRIAFPGLDLVLLESGGDNLASTFSLDLVDYWMFVIDVADGDDIPRKRGPGIVSCDLLIINKIDLAPYVGADVGAMQRDSLEVRNGKPVLLTNCRSGEGVDAVIDRIARDALLLT